MNRLVEWIMAEDVKQGLEKATGASQHTFGGWETAVGLTERWLARAERVDTLLEGLPSGLTGQERARAQQLFYGVVRWSSRLEASLAGLMASPPRTKVKAILIVAGFELLEGGPALTAKVIHHAVGKAKTVASAKEAGLVNAVARKLALRLAPDEKVIVAPNFREALHVKVPRPPWAMRPEEATDVPPACMADAARAPGVDAGKATPSAEGKRRAQSLEM